MASQRFSLFLLLATLVFSAWVMPGDSGLDKIRRVSVTGADGFPLAATFYSTKEKAPAVLLPKPSSGPTPTGLCSGWGRARISWR